jgi:DNA-binding transcriptional LysR family regulator
VADKDHPDLKKGLTLERYLRLSHCVTRFPGDSQSLIERTWSKLGLQIRAGAISPGFMVTLFTLSHTGLIGTVPRKLAVLHADSLGLRIHKSPVRLEPIDEYLFWHPIDDEDPAHGYLRSLFQSCAQRLPKLGRALGSNGSLRRVPPRTSVK